MIAPKPHKQSYKSTLWPWKYWMTIGIGVTCSEKKPNDCLILATDKLGSYGEEFSTRRHAKLFLEPEHLYFAVCSGDVNAASELSGKIIQQWASIYPGNRVYGELRAGIQQAAFEYKNYQFHSKALFTHAIGPKDDWRKIAQNLAIEDQLLEEWGKTELGCSLIVGTYDTEKVAHVFCVKANGSAMPLGSSGFDAIGSGGYAAMFWLSFRQQSVGMSLRRSALHVFEAKLMAEHSPYVGRDDIEMLIVTPERWYHLTVDRPSTDGCPVSLGELKELASKFGPSSTASLGDLKDL